LHMLRAVIAEDEKLARQRLKRLLLQHADIEVVGEAGDGGKALEMVNELKPDILFLDIQMPVMTGVEIVAQFTHLPHIIFTTAYDRYAVNAFEIGAVDYLLKPITEEGITRSLERVRSRAKASPADASVLDRILKTLQGMQDKERYVSILTASQGDRIKVLPIETVHVLRAEDRYVICYTDSGEYVTDNTIKELADTLDLQKFLQVHRSIIVKISAIRDIRRSLFTKSGYEVTVAGVSDPLPIGKTYLPALRERLRF
jgi:two-component system, LytTR family, response regulator